MTTEQLTLDLPEATDHGVVFSINNQVVNRVLGLSSQDDCYEHVDALQAHHAKQDGVTWDYEPRPTGWYGLSQGNVYTIAIY